MFLNGYKHREIQGNLGISSGFISKWTQMYELLGVGLKLGYLIGRLSRGATATGCHPWLQTKTTGTSPNCKYVQQEYDVVFDSKQSYYSLFEEAGISWKKHRNVIPKRPRTGQKKRQEITDWLEAHRAQIALWAVGLLRR